MSWSARTAIVTTTEWYLKQQTFISQSLSPRLRCQQIQFLMGTLFLTYGFLLHPQVVDRGSSGVSSSSYKGTNLTMGGSTLMTSFEPNYLPKAPLTDNSRLRVRASTCGLGVGDTNIQYITMNKVDICRFGHGK